MARVTYLHWKRMQTVIMEDVSRISTIRKADTKSFFLISILACIPVYWACLFYIKAVTGEKIEELAFAAALCFFGFFYIGWILSRIWVAHNKIRREIFVVLSVLILATVIWLFAHADIQFHSMPAINLLLFWLPFVLLSTLLGALVNMARISMQAQLQEARATAEQSKTELHLLQSQLSPHFLFNTLNNLYGLSLTQHEKLPPLLLKLSELLRYSVYDVKELFVPLKNEMAYINNYIEFEKIRNGNRLVLKTSFEVINNEEIKIAPMLLTTFIENAFKHSKNTSDKEIFVEMEIKTWSDRILFSIKNSYKAAEEKMGLNKNSGLGLVNAKKRLALLYPNEHELRIEEKDGFYNVMLQLKAK